MDRTKPLCFNESVSLINYKTYVHQIVDSYLSAGGAPQSVSKLSKPVGISSQPKILILAPHPDDECLMAGFALRAKEEWNAEVFVLPFSFGSDVSRRQARIQELKDSLHVLDFKLIDPRLNGATEKLSQPEFEAVMNQLVPDVVISPHLADHHPAHIETARMVQAFLSANAKSIVWLQTEYWQQNGFANEFLPLSTEHVIQIGEALQKHRGEISRNPYHLRLPAWYIDQARRAQELLTNFGGAVAPQFMFGQLLQRVDMQSKAPKP